MKTYLFPSKFKKLGWILFIFFLIFYAFSLFTNIKIEWEVPVFAIVNEYFLSNDYQWFTVIKNDIVGEIFYIGLIVSLLFIAFSKEKDEDEYMAKLRANSLVWALLVNSILLIFEILFIYGFPFLYVLIINQFSVLILYIAKFNFTLYRVRKSVQDEE